MTGAAQHTAPNLPAPSAPLGQQAPECIALHQRGRSSQPAPEPGVGQMSPAEIDAHIASLGLLVVRAMRLGDRATALELQRLQQEARAARSRAHVAAQDAEHLRRVEDACYFSSDAALAQGREGIR